MAGKMKDRIGQRNGKLTVIEFYKKENNNIFWKCKCDCGKEIIVKSKLLKERGVKSCGCLYKETRYTNNLKHGMYKTRIYKTWLNMKSRCNTPSASKYYLYGGKGIKVCEEWKNDFISFYNWAIDNGYRDDLTIDRINPDGNYEPNNCRWATYKEQNSHLSGDTPKQFAPVFIEYKGQKLNLKDWAKEININYKTLLARYERGWSIERMLETPTIKKIKRGDDGRWKLS